jgi:hypothetical protein
MCKHKTRVETSRAAICLKRHAEGCVPRITVATRKQLRSISQTAYCFELSTYTRIILFRNQTSSRQTETNTALFVSQII